MTDDNSTKDPQDPAPSSDQPDPVAKSGPVAQPDQPDPVAKDVHYTPTLSPNPEETMDEDNEQIGEENPTDLGGTVERENVVDQGKGPSIAGTPGHPGIDEDTG